MSQDDGWLPMMFAIHCEVGVFNHVSPDPTSFIRERMGSCGTPRRRVSVGLRTHLTDQG